MFRSLFLFLVLSTTFAHADAFCDKSAEQIRDDLYAPQARLAFQNDGGLIDGGVCWWHSRFQRAAQLLVKFRPDYPKPDHATAKDLIKKIRMMMGVVQVPGYSNLEDFSRDFQKEIQARLNAWQIFDGFLLQRWVIGLQGNSSVDPSILMKTMRDTYDLVMNKNQIAFLKLQYPGITAHAWLVIGMEKNASETEWKLKVVDSNSPDKTRVITVHSTDHFIKEFGDDQLVPYLNFNMELKRLVNARDQFCGRTATFPGVKPARIPRSMQHEDEFVESSMNVSLAE